MKISSHMVIAAVVFLVAASTSAQTYTDAQAKALSESYTFEANGSYDNAIAALGAPGSDYFFNLRLGWLYYLNGNWKLALQHYTNAEKVELKSVEAKIGLMNTFYYMKDFPRVGEYAKSVMSFDPANYTARSYEILIDLQSKDYRSAALRVNDALKLYPIDAKLNSYRAQVLFYQGRKEDARNVVKMLTTIYGKTNAEVIALEKLLK